MSFVEGGVEKKEPVVRGELCIGEAPPTSGAEREKNKIKAERQIG